jgi:hypothetical protein
LGYHLQEWFFGGLNYGGVAGEFEKPSGFIFR